MRSLPVITVSDPQRLQRDGAYRERSADALMELLFDVERIRGTGRQYIP